MPVLLVLALALIGAACGIAGAFILLGAGWALVTASGFCLLFAAILRAGISNG